MVCVQSFTSSAIDTEACRKIWVDLPAQPIRQTTDYTCGPVCIDFLLKSNHHPSPGEKKLAHELNTSVEKGTQPGAIADYFKGRGFTANVEENLTVHDLSLWLRRGGAVIALIELKGEGHWVVVTAVDDDTVYYMDPYQGQFLEMAIQEFQESWSTDHFGSRQNYLAIIIGDLS